jgi:hypothetical protein
MSDGQNASHIDKLTFQNLNIEHFLVNRENEVSKGVILCQDSTSAIKRLVATGTRGEKLGRVRKWERS